MPEKKFMRKVCVSVDVDVQLMHMWVEDQGTNEKTLAMVKAAMGEDTNTLLDDADITINASFTECADEAMDDQAVTEEGGWIHVADLTDDEGNPVEPTSDERYLDPEYRQRQWYREELEKQGQQRLPGFEDKKDGD